MSYLNPVQQHGMHKYCNAAVTSRLYRVWRQLYGFTKESGREDRQAEVFGTPRTAPWGAGRRGGDCASVPYHGLNRQQQ